MSFCFMDFDSHWALHFLSRLKPKCYQATLKDESGLFRLSQTDSFRFKDWDILCSNHCLSPLSFWGWLVGLSILPYLRRFLSRSFRLVFHSLPLLVFWGNDLRSKSLCQQRIGRMVCQRATQDFTTHYVPRFSIFIAMLRLSGGGSSRFHGTP